MRKLIPFILFLSFGLMSMVSVEWEVFKSYDGKFQVLIPGKMELKEKAIETQIGTLKYNTYIYQPTEKDPDNLAYMVSYCDYPLYSVHSDSTEFLEEFFETTIETAAESVHGELLYSSEITIDEFPGRLWRVDYNEGQAMIKTKAFMVKNRYYSVQVIALKEKSLNLSMDKYLDSFSLLKELPKPE